jgi:activator of 2-hydroxyglutaryl-CoA dehydratase
MLLSATASRQSMMIRHVTKLHGGIWGSQATTVAATAARRFKSTDVGDVIGIDLGTTNSCVAIMVSKKNVMDGLQVWLPVANTKEHCNWKCGEDT